MGRLKLFATTLPALVFAAGCTTMYGTVLPQADGSYQVITAQKSKSATLKAVQSDAENTCKKATGNKRFVSLGADSEFTGVTIDRGEGGTTRSVVASALEFAAKLENDTNYETMMTFRCVADGPPAYVAVQPMMNPVPATAPATAPSSAPVASPSSNTNRTMIDDIYRRATAAQK